MDQRHAASPRAGTRPGSTVRWLALTGLAGVVVWWTVIVVLGALDPGYSHASDFISALGAVNAPYAPVQRVNFGVLGASIIAFAVGLDRWHRAGWRHWLGVLLLGVVGLGIIGAGVFQGNPAAEQSTTHVYHNRVSTVAFLAALVGIPLTTWRLARDERWPGYHHWVVPVGMAALMLAGVVVFGISIDTWLAGIGQRLYVGLFTGWVAYHSYGLSQATAAGAPHS